MAFKAADITSKKTQKEIENLFAHAFSMTHHLVSPQNLTIIDAVFHRVRTTSEKVHNESPFHAKVPHRMTYLHGRMLGTTIVDNFISNTIDNLTEKSPNW